MCTLAFKLHTSSMLTDRLEIAVFFKEVCLKCRLTKLENKWPVPVDSEELLCILAAELLMAWELYKQSPQSKLHSPQACRLMSRGFQNYSSADFKKACIHKLLSSDAQLQNQSGFASHIFVSWRLTC